MRLIATLLLFCLLSAPVAAQDAAPAETITTEIETQEITEIPPPAAAQIPDAATINAEQPLLPKPADGQVAAERPLLPPVMMPQEPPKPAEMENTGYVVVRTIDKLSARTHTFDIPVDKTVKFGNSLFIKVRACRKSSPLNQPENAAFLQIWERKPHEEESKWIFSGWMFSSSPSLSSMDHPVYDVWVISCKNKSTARKDESFSTESAPAAAPDAVKDSKPAAEKPAAEEPEENLPTD
jgi:hypothetical protein